ncbi:uncharacterized protein P7C73_g2982, partial [Tremellales sp. Uapishka_1]
MSLPAPLPQSQHPSLGPPITHPLPTTTSLLASAPSLDSGSDADKLAWAQDVLRVHERHLYPSGPPSDLTSPPQSPPSKAHVPAALMDLLDQAIPIIISSTSLRDPSLAALASYLKAKLLASGSCAEYLPRDPRQAFKDFESAARGGEVRGWFRLGRDYEGVGDTGRAKDCFERGRNKGDGECTYRMGMAHLLGQLGLPSSPSIALPLLRIASERSTVDFPQPSYVYGMLLAGELVTHVHIPPSLVLPSNSAASDALFAQHSLAREAIENAAYLCHPPAQYKCGFLYEHAALGCPYDPLMSVQWYSLASQGGEIEADMALSKWFLCGADGHFGKNEQLARTFAEKSARKGLPNGCFAMGYYYELGIGGRKDTDQARKWYQKAAKMDNQEAINRLAALSQPEPTMMSLQEHESRVNDTLVRSRTLAKNRSDHQSISRPARGVREGRRRRDTEVIRSIEAGVGDIVTSPYIPQGQNSWPSRPPIPQTFERPGYSLQDPPRRPSAGSGKEDEEPKRRPAGPQTFAEMGFVSKPVEEDGCVIM